MEKELSRIDVYTERGMYIEQLIIYVRTDESPERLRFRLVSGETCTPLDATAWRIDSNGEVLHRWERRKPE